MKDLDTLIQKAQAEGKTSATRSMKDFANMEVETEKRMQLTRMHDYKGFTVEPIVGGFNIVVYGRKNTLYVAGPGGWRLTEDMREARAFRDPKTCHDLIDEVIADWQGWIDSTKGAKPVVNTDGPKQEQVLQPGGKLAQEAGIKSEAGVKYRSSSVVM